MKYARGKAFIFHDEHHTNHAKHINKCLLKLEYATELFITDEILTKTGVQIIEWYF